VIHPKALLSDLKGEVKRLEMELRPIGEEDTELHAEWEGARAAERTAAPFETWLTDRVTQVAVAWILATVFVRFAEDNDLIEYPYLAGPNDEGNERTAQARERQEQYFYDHPERTDRDWIKAAFNEMGKSPVARALFAEHNPMWSILPSNDAAKALLAFWRKTDANGAIVHDFTDPTWNTRFLGDLYQDLSEATRKTYALLQTPEFVEEFILNYTLDPAIEEFGLEPEPPFDHANLPRRLRVIDPACGSGHFLLGAFRRLLTAWEAHSPMTDRWQLIANALSSVHGADKNPYAAAIARYRLMLAAMKEGNVTRLTEKVDFTLNIGVGDSLIHGDWTSEEQGEFDLGDRKPPYMYRTEDIGRYISSVEMLASGTYHAVFANPPYITVRDKAESDLYRERYKSCYREYSLSVPFAERIFKLAVVGTVEGVSAGYTGQITANSFMKREFGKKLIEEYFAYQIDLTHIIDTSGAYIPSHGTPTVILFGRRRFPRRESTIRAVLGIRGEPGEPVDAAKGFVWRAIIEQVKGPGSNSQLVSVVDAQRSEYAKHPWSLGGSGEGKLRAIIESEGSAVLHDSAQAIGYGAISGEDDAYFFPADASTSRIDANNRTAIMTGDVVRDYVAVPDICSLWPYRPSFQLRAEADIPEVVRYLWPSRRNLQARKRFGIPVDEIDGFCWYEYRELYVSKMISPLSVTFAEVATHNHFVLDRGGSIFKQTAPIIKLSEYASDDDYLGLLGVLNSSTGGFWLKQSCHVKGGSGIGRGVQDEAWEDRYAFNVTRVEQFPLPPSLPWKHARELDSLGQQLAIVEPSAVCASSVPTRERLDGAQSKHGRTYRRMVALQEELDWDVYRRYGLITETEAAELVVDPVSVPDLNLGERAFEIVMARRVARGELETQWFARHRSTPVTEAPGHWPDAYKAVVARRIEFIEADRNIGLIERPEYKRRWQSAPWEEKEAKALTAWLLDRYEDRSLWYGPDGQPRPMTVNNLADRLRADADFVSVARLLGGPDTDLADVLAGILDVEHVPYLAQYRYKNEGLVKRAVWEQTWNLQREEDKTGKTLDIPVPPKYASVDFLKPSYWRNRGKLDVPKERFISYPGASPDGDDSLLLGWAGWDHREQAYALITLITQRSATDGWDTSRLTPLIAGMAEIMPWVRQWHNEVDPSFGQSPADAYDEFLTAQRLTHHLTDQDLAEVKPFRAATRRKPGAARGKAGAPKSTGFVPVVLSDQ
jgi:hypothetical protein